MTSVVDASHLRQLEVLDPVAPAAATSAGAQIVETLDHKSVSIIANGWASWVNLRDLMIAELHGSAPSISIQSWDVPLGSRAALQVLESIAAQSDAVVIGLANCGSCAVSLAANAAFLMGEGLPVVATVTERFEGLVHSLQPALPLIVFPSSLEQLDEVGLEEMKVGLWAQLESKMVGTDSHG